jgi:hypothetical protein
MDTLSKAVLMALLCASPWALAATWEDYDESADGAIFYLDTSSIKATGKKRTAWTKVVHETPAPYNDGMLKHWVALIEVDCKAQRQRTLSEVGYKPDGTQLYQFQFGEDKEATPVIPDSFGETRLKKICTYKLSAK